MSFFTPFRLLALVAFAQHLSAQCLPQILNCPAASVQVCDTSQNNTQFWNSPQWLDPAIGSQNMPDAPVDLSITASSPCSGALTIRYLLFLDLNGDGQQETVINSQQLPPAGTVRFNNINTPNYAGGQSRIFDQRPVQALFRYKFAIETKSVGGVTTARLRWRSNATVVGGVSPQLPYGTHRIRWTVKSSGGEETICEYQIMVKDCGKPTVTCVPGAVSFDIPVTGETTLWASDFLSKLSDNYWPNTQLQIALRKAGTGIGFPVDGLDLPQTKLTFHCNELGDNAVEVWGKDPSGNIQSCVSHVNIQNNFQNCGIEKGRITVCAVRYCNNQPVKNFEVSVGASNEIVTDSAGCKILEFSGLGPNATNTLNVFSDDNPSGGIEQIDLDLIGKHYLGLQQLPLPWGLIAADVNKSGSITGFDISELGKILDGTYTEFPNNTSWRFVPDDFVFPDPSNPFKTPFPESIGAQVGTTLQNHGKYLFHGIKIGDVNCSLNVTGQPSEERHQRLLEQATFISQPQPNPTTGGTTIRLRLLEASAVHVMLSDLSGRETFRQDIAGQAGEQSIEIPASSFPQAGFYLWKIQAEKETKSGKIIRQ